MSKVDLSVDNLTDEQCCRLLKSIFGIDEIDYEHLPEPDPEVHQKLTEFLNFIRKTEDYKVHKEEV